MQIVQLSMFDEEPLTYLEENLLRGSGFENGRVRIYVATNNLNDKDLAVFLKEEYGIGGSSIKNGMMDYNSKGIHLRSWDGTKDESYNWNYIAKCIRKLVETSRYLSNNDKIKLNKVREDNNGKLPMPRPRLRY